MDVRLLSVLIGITFGLIVGVFVARKSAAGDAVRGGAAPALFHYLACAAFSASFPSALVAIFTRQGIGGALLDGLGFALLSLAFTLVYAVFERPARARLVDDGWTEEQARASGM